MKSFVPAVGDPPLTDLTPAVGDEEVSADVLLSKLFRHVET